MIHEGSTKLNPKLPLLLSYSSSSSSSSSSYSSSSSSSSSQNPLFSLPSFYLVLCFFLQMGRNEGNGLYKLCFLLASSLSHVSLWCVMDGKKMRRNGL